MPGRELLRQQDVRIRGVERGARGIRDGVAEDGELRGGHGAEGPGPETLDHLAECRSPRPPVESDDAGLEQDPGAGPARRRVGLRGQEGLAGLFEQVDHARGGASHGLAPFLGPGGHGLEDDGVGPEGDVARDDLSRADGDEAEVGGAEADAEGAEPDGRGGGEPEPEAAVGAGEGAGEGRGVGVPLGDDEHAAGGRAVGEAGRAGDLLRSDAGRHGHQEGGGEGGDPEGRYLSHRRGFTG